MTKCTACGASLLVGATWCAQCFEPVGAAAATVSSNWQGPVAPPARAERAMRTTRWAKTDTTFGPVGRLLAWVDANTHQIVKNVEIDPGSYNQVAVDPVSGFAYVATQPAVGGTCLSACVFVYSPTS